MNEVDPDIDMDGTEVEVPEVVMVDAFPPPPVILPPTLGDFRSGLEGNNHPFGPYRQRPLDRAMQSTFILPSGEHEGRGYNASHFHTKTVNYLQEVHKPCLIEDVMASTELKFWWPPIAGSYRGNLFPYAMQENIPAPRDTGCYCVSTALGNQTKYNAW
ncbi:hypothetical protein DXG03_008242 [Asterophora parasitica]|uniref:Uncharacterized protein n=1 Tax=Asterophora parasitica TaxID=117018 RepID=A0A9P7GBZ8_9AGAR|nr:hypothetical protein DXG03_008242 [Asterophora parasitica]